jgi:hypothetical protein
MLDWSKGLIRIDPGSFMIKELHVNENYNLKTSNYDCKEDNSQTATTCINDIIVGHLKCRLPWLKNERYKGT